MNLGRFGLLLALGCLQVSPARANCLEYGPATVMLTGMISERVDPGPPGYGETPARDAKELHYYLRPDEAVCVAAKPGDEVDVAESGVKEMQMVYFNPLPFRREWLGKHVRVQGTLFHGISGHHHTAVLINVSGTHVMKVKLEP